MKPYIDDATPAIAIAILLFLMPSESPCLRVNPLSGVRDQYKANSVKISYYRLGETVKSFL